MALGKKSVDIDAVDGSVMVVWSKYSCGAAVVPE
jgi:hypothetical protein